VGGGVNLCAAVRCGWVEVGKGGGGLLYALVQ
jgi:hypothetical protein